MIQIDSLEQNIKVYLFYRYPAKMNSSEHSGYQEANLNAGHHLNVEELNELHPLWSKDLLETGSPDYKPSSQKVSFSKETRNRDEVGKDMKEKTDFMERGNRPLCKALKVVEASVYDKPIYQVFLGEENKFVVNAVDIIIGDILECLVKGETYRFNNSSSTKLRPSPAIINKIKVAYVKFRYFANLQPLPTSPRDEKTYTLEGRMEVLKVLPIQETNMPTLVRQASRSVFCDGPKVDDLEERYLKLLGR